MSIDLKDHCYAMVDSLDKNLMEGWRSSSLEKKTVMTKPVVSTVTVVVSCFLWGGL